MEPFGHGNRKPIFLFSNVLISQMRKVGKLEKHLQLSVHKSGAICRGIGFNQGAMFEDFNSEHPIDVVFELDDHEWNGRHELQCTIIDMRRSLLPV